MTRVRRRAGRRQPSRAAPAQSVADRRAVTRTRDTADQSARPGQRQLLTGALILAAVSFALYLPAVARDIVVGDSAEFATVSVTLGVAHPPGYPILTMLEHLSALLAFGAVPFRVNVLSAVFSAVTVALVFSTAARLTRSLASAALAAGLLAVNELFWRWSLVAETFPLNDLIAAALVLCLVVWQERPTSGRYLVLAAFFGGLGLANHQTIVLLGGGILFLLVRQWNTLRRRPGLIAACAAAVVVGMLPYAYLPWAASHQPTFNWGNISTFNDVVAHFLRASYGTSELTSEAAFRGGSAVSRVVALGLAFGPLLGALAVLGAVEASRRRRWYLWFVVLTFAAAGPGFVAYANLNLSLQFTLFVLERFFLLPLVLTAPLAAFGVEFLVRTLAEGLPPMARFSRPVVSIATLIAVIVTGAFAYPRVDVSHDQIARHYAEDLLTGLDQNAVLLAKGDEIVLPVAYLQEVEHVRPDITLVILGLLGGDWYVSQLKRRHPELIIPFPRYNAQTAPLKALVAANPGRTIMVLDEPLPDDSLSSGYWYYTRGLAEQVLPLAEDRDLPQLAAENERLFSAYRVPSLSEVNQQSLERELLTQYALADYRVGHQYEELQMTDMARTWYQRALAIDPVLASALDAIKRVTP